MEESTAPVNKGSRVWKLLLKLVVTGLCLWYVSGKIDFGKAGAALNDANWILLTAATAAFIASKLFSAIRLNIYFANIQVHLSQVQNIRLYWLGMFYNLFLPGAISGDGYKVIMLKKRFQSNYRKLTSAVLLDRVSGLVGLVIILAVNSVSVLSDNYIIALVSGVAVLSVAALYLVNRYWLRDFMPGFWSTLGWGLVVQATQVGCAVLIMMALGISEERGIYMFLFLLSSMASVLPLTIGGLGIREMVFLEGSGYFGLAGEQAVLISLIFYLITLLTSAFGAYYQFRDPLK